MSEAEREAEIRRHLAELRARPRMYRRDLLVGVHRPEVRADAADPAYLERAVVELVRGELGPAAAEWDDAALAAAARRALEEAGLAAPDKDDAETPTEVGMAAQEAVRQFLNPEGLMSGRGRSTPPATGGASGRR